jgi:hypothetical protein
MKTLSSFANFVTRWSVACLRCPGPVHRAKGIAGDVQFTIATPTRHLPDGIAGPLWSGGDDDDDRGGLRDVPAGGIDTGAGGTAGGDEGSAVPGAVPYAAGGALLVAAATALLRRVTGGDAFDRPAATTATT